jgi:hypothetical protein
VQTLYVPRYGRRVLDGLGSLDRNEAESWLRERTVWHHEVQVAEFEVPIRTLDEFGLGPCLVKIDVQGTETAVVAGGLETIREHRPALFVEAPDAGLLQLLAPLRYRKYGLRRGKLDNDAQHTKNALFLPAA